jgi:3-hydroxyacyl-CoA dehydrogenase
MAGTQSAAQRYAFFAERDAAKIPAADMTSYGRPIAAVGVLFRTCGGNALIDRFRASGARVVAVDLNSSPSQRADLSDCDLIIDLDPAQGEAEQMLTRRLAAAVATDTVLASPSPMDSMADSNWRHGNRLRSRFSPAVGVPCLLEIILPPYTDKDTLTRALILAKRAGIVPVVVRNGDRFIGERILTRLQREIFRLLDHGVAPYDINRVLARFGLHVGPFEASISPQRRRISDDEILERCVYPMIDEAVLIIDERAVARGSDIDVACVKGYGWPVYRGGPMFHGDILGLRAVVDRLQSYEQQFGPEMRPSRLLQRLAETGAKLHTL